jgi:xanthine/CO dehydrogenase XdhC/CoxF family maturation factor
MPIGIPFATVTAEEIAISILAQLIDCKNSIF